MEKKIFIKDLIGNHQTSLIVKESTRLFMLVMNSHFEKRKEWGSLNIPIEAINRNTAIVIVGVVRQIVERAMSGMSSDEIKNQYINELTGLLNELRPKGEK